MEKIIAQCSNCQAKHKVDAEKIGKKLRCPKCQGVFVVAEFVETPAAAPKAAPAAPVSDKIVAQCANCQAKLKVDAEKIGKKVKCPKCQGVFVVADSEAAPQPEAPKAAPREEKPKPLTPPPTAAKPAPAVKIEKAPEPPAEPAVVPLKDRPRPLQVKDFFETQLTRFIPEKAEGVDAHVSYNIEGEGGGEWNVMVKNGACTIRQGGDATAKTQVKMSSKTYLKLAQGKLDGRVGFMLGQIKIKGDKSSVATLRECFRVPEI